MTTTTRKKRQAIPPKVRFEVLKRDSFKCQYCGATGEDTLLHVDHIDPVASGGDNSIINLVTSCSTCNFGKGAVKLSDDAALKKQHSQLEELQAMREQRKLMVQWREELKCFRDEDVAQLAQYWSKIASGYEVNDAGRQALRKHLRKYSPEEIEATMDETHKYLVFEAGRPTEESVSVAWDKVGAICYVTKRNKENPEEAELYKIRSYLKLKEPWFGGFDPDRTMSWLKAARTWDISIQELRDIAALAKSMNSLSDLIDDAIAIKKEELAARERNASAESLASKAIKQPPAASNDRYPEDGPLSDLWQQRLGEKHSQWWLKNLLERAAETEKVEALEKLTPLIYETALELIEERAEEHFKSEWYQWESAPGENPPPFVAEAAEMNTLAGILVGITKGLINDMTSRSPNLDLLKTAIPLFMYLAALEWDTLDIREYHGRLMALVMLVTGRDGPIRSIEAEKHVALLKSIANLASELLE